MRIFLILTSTTLLWISLVSCGAQPNKYNFKTGDLIFQTCKSDQSLAIQLATRSKYSHVGMIVIKGNKTLVLEAVGPVKLTPIESFINNGVKQHYVVKRLKNASTALSEEKTVELLNSSNPFMGKPYDFLFAWSNEKIYCSELVWKMYKNTLNIEIGQLQKLADFDLSHPVVKQKLTERYGSNIPLNELVISPGAMFESDLLITIKD